MIKLFICLFVLQKGMLKACCLLSVSQNQAVSSTNQISNNSIIFVKDLLFHLNIEESFNCVTRKLSKTNISIWAGLRHSIPINLKLDTPENSLALTAILKIKNNTFDVIEKKIKRLL